MELVALHLTKIREKLCEFIDPSQRADAMLASAPGRADFLNTHQDYKGLPVVPVAVRLRCYAAGSLNGTNDIRFASVNLREKSQDFRDEFSLDNVVLRGGGWFGDYVRAIFSFLQKGARKTAGMDIAVWSDVPIGSGLSSSASLEVSVVQLASTCLGYELDRRELAETAYGAEHDVMGIPCGRLDQYASAYGEIIKLETKPPFKVEHLSGRDLLFVIVYSGEQRRITSVHPIRQQEIDDALRLLMDEVRVPKQLAKKLGYRYYDPRWEDIAEEEISPYFASLPEKLANRILFTLRMQRSTEYALGLLEQTDAHVSPARNSQLLEAKGGDRLAGLGMIMNYQHELLRDLYEVSTPTLERLRNTLLASGVLGAKISGAGGGGSVISLVRDHDIAERVRKACVASGFSEVWVSTPDVGATVESD